jgi:dihydroneopterin aldolase
MKVDQSSCLAGLIREVYDNRFRRRRRRNFDGPQSAARQSAPGCGIFGRPEEGLCMMSQVEKITSLPSSTSQRTLKVFVRDLVLPCHIGVFSHEKLGTQRVRINLELLCAEHPAINDEHAKVVCYDQIITEIKQLIAEKHINLVETLAEQIAALCLQDYRVHHAKVRVEKLDVFAEAEAVGVEIERQRQLR